MGWNRRTVSGVVGIIMAFSGVMGLFKTGDMIRELFTKGLISQPDYSANVTTGVLLWAIPMLLGLLLFFSSLFGRPRN